MAIKARDWLAKANNFRHVRAVAPPFFGRIWSIQWKRCCQPLLPWQSTYERAVFVLKAFVIFTLVMGRVLLCMHELGFLPNVSPL